MTPLDVPDPRRFAPSTMPPVRALHERVERRLAQASTAAAEALDAQVRATLREWLVDGEGAWLDAGVHTAPSPAIARHLLRLLPGAEREALVRDTLAVALFALPVVVVAAADGTVEAPLTVHATLPAREALHAALREPGAFATELDVALAGTLAAPPALALARMPALVAQGRAWLEGAASPLDLAPAPIVVAGTQERAHLRFVAGTAVTGVARDPLADRPPGPWALAAARALSASLALPGATVLALPRAPQRMCAAWAVGFAAQREVALQLFVAAALRALRSRYGEPTAVISAHECPEAPGGGELRLSLSTPLDARAAEGFRYPLGAWESARDGAAALQQLLADCRVGDLRVEAALQPDRDPATGLVRFCRPEEPSSPRH